MIAFVLAVVQCNMELVTLLFITLLEIHLGMCLSLDSIKLLQ